MDSVKLGPCCECEGGKGAHNLIQLQGVLCPIPDRGWGCLVCHTTMSGAMAVLCQPCCQRWLKEHFTPRLACRGYPGTDGRVPFGQLLVGDVGCDPVNHVGGARR